MPLKSAASALMKGNISSFNRSIKLNCYILPIIYRLEIAMNIRRFYFLSFLLSFSILISTDTQAENYWGRKIPDQPIHFIFGYGSLINTESRNATAVKPIPAIPARISASFGYTRAWVFNCPCGFTALGLREPRDGESANTINGVLYPVEGDDMTAFDQREAGYKRVEVPLQFVEALSWQQLPEHGKIWIYVSEGTDGQPGGKGLEGPTSQLPLLQSYIDVVLRGGLEYGEDFARELIETTADWSDNWLDDRELPRRPWVFTKDASKIDRLLQSTTPAASYFKERLFPEVFVVKRLVKETAE